jgi:hypothetical protein
MKLFVYKRRGPYAATTDGYEVNWIIYSSIKFK